MMRYRLPDELGGAIVDHHGSLRGDDTVSVNLPGVGFIYVPHGCLTEIPPPVPDEPEPGAYDIGGVLCVRMAKRGGQPWLVDIDRPDLRLRMDWPSLVEVLGIDPDVKIRRLEPDPAPVVSASRLELFRASNFHVGGVGQEYWVGHLRLDGQIIGSGITLEPDEFRTVAALLSAAGHTEDHADGPALAVELPWSYAGLSVDAVGTLVVLKTTFEGPELPLRPDIACDLAAALTAAADRQETNDE
jgi:hypothetical protein